MKILMVCLGNICRSPLAEGILQQKAKDAGLDWIVESAGTNGFHTGEAPHHLSQKVAKKYGIDISCQVSRKFERHDIVAYDKIYAMADDVLTDIRNICGADYDDKKVDLFLNELRSSKNKNVPDPWYGDEDGYEEVYQLINITCDAIIENYLTTTNQTATI